MKDYYKILGVPRNASLPHLKRAYRYLIKGCHPDVNHSPKAAEWTRELNEAYDVLSNAQSKMSYDISLRLAESKQKETTAQPASTNQTRTESGPPPRAEPNLCCERCQRVDASLRLSVTWRVYSFLTQSRKSPTVKILCGRCRVKESLAASFITFIVGWWSVWGFFWTLEALFNNARGGEQPKDNNAALLNSLSYKLYRNRRYQEANEALQAALRFKPDPKTEDMLKHIKQQGHHPKQKPFWERFHRWELHPGFYHVPIGTIAIILIILGFNALNANSSTRTTGTTNRQHDSYSATVGSKSPSIGESNAFEDLIPEKNRSKRNLQPIFAEPEQPMPKQGLMEFSSGFGSYSGEKAPLKITTKPSDGNYVMKLVDWNTGEFVASCFISRGSTLDIEVPFGSYKLKFACGDKWYGTKFLFGPRTSYSYIPDKLVFYQDGEYARGHRIELIPQVGGNLETRGMQATDW